MISARARRALLACAALCAAPLPAAAQVPLPPSFDSGTSPVTRPADRTVPDPTPDNAKKAKPVERKRKEAGAPTGGLSSYPAPTRTGQPTAEPPR